MLDAASVNSRRASRAHVAPNDSGHAQQRPAPNEAAPVAGEAAPVTGESSASCPVLGSLSAAGPPLQRPATFGSTGAAPTNGSEATRGNSNMLLSLRDSCICEAEITSCGTPFAMRSADNLPLTAYWNDAGYVYSHKRGGFAPPGLETGK